MEHEAGLPDLMLFQAEKGIDERSLAGLQELEPTDQVVVMDMVRHQECKNPSAVTWSAVRAIKKNPSGMRLEYILKHADQRCSDALARLSRDAQSDLAMRIDFTKCRNISALIWSQVKGMTPPPRSGGGGGAGGHAHGPSTAAVPSGRPVFAVRGGGAGAGAGAGRRPLPLPPPAPPQMPPARTEPVARNQLGLDSKAMASLAELGPEEQIIVMQLVEKQACKNPSAVCWSMIKHVRGDPIEAKRQYVRSLLDPDAAADLESLSTEEQLRLISQVDIVRCRNVNAFLVSRVKALGTGGIAVLNRQADRQSARSGGRQPLPPPRLPPPRAPPRPRAPPPTPRNRSRSPRASEDANLAAFAAGFNLDARATEALADLNPSDRSLAMQLLEQGSPRNPSAVCWSMVKLVRDNPSAARARLGRSSFGTPRTIPEEEELPGLGELDASLADDAGDLDAMLAEPVAVEEELPDPETVAGITLDSRCLEALRKLPAETQFQILESVDTSKCRNPSAFVFSRIRLLDKR